MSPELPAPPLGPVVLIGAGLIGTSIGQALTAAGVQVEVRDANPSHARVAVGRGAGTQTPVDPAEVALVVVAVPPRAIAAVVDEALDVYRNAVVTDVGSVKEPQLRELIDHRSLSRYVGSHPMAGSHLAGPLAASADLFSERTWVITPHEDSAPEAIATVEALARLCDARLITMAPADHDRAVGRVSHLPHLVSVLMAGQLAQMSPDDLALAGQGVRDVTRIAGGDPGLWEQIVSANARVLVPELQALADRLSELTQRLERTEPDVRPLLAQANAGVRKLPGKHGASAVDYASIVIEIPDAPGSLARLFGDVDAAGVNVEDVAIEHDPMRLVGHLRIYVHPDREQALTRAMTDAGWRVSTAAPPL
ncbi:prephenate dehydrogenase [Naumannella halotolerans]|uniref:prephenate dehydrogenase n=1 Tax=Naumannella halotolerans TaxID=993414 RepID=UPI001AB01641|nr:prephenate dehydrogenase [Naumannella halotolerans]